MTLEPTRRKLLMLLSKGALAGVLGSACGQTDNKEALSMKNAKEKTRTVNKIIWGQKTSDGAGVKLTRLIGTHDFNYLDPFLLLDEFRSENPDDYINGFPPHPHRGIETLTYMIDGSVEHKDHLGHQGTIENGDVQWMTAGSGIIHSEMPKMKQGRLWGLQLWINLRASQKMCDPHYREVKANTIPIVTSDLQTVRIIAGNYNQTQGAVTDIDADPLYLDIQLQNHAVFQTEISPIQNAFILVLKGQIAFPQSPTSTAKPKELVILNRDAEKLKVKAVDDARFILAAGKPLNEPVARGGPFVMNTEKEIQLAWREYQLGTFLKTSAKITDI